MNAPRARHPVTPIVMGLFFAIGAAITLARGFSLLWPGSALDAMWRIKPEEHQQLLRAGLPAAVGFVWPGSNHGDHKRRGIPASSPGLVARDDNFHHQWHRGCRTRHVRRAS